jgi:succinoglycan biosynthesis transport protein ExoP
MQLEKYDPNLPAVAAPPAGSYYAPDATPAEAATPLSHYLWILKRHRWKILSFVGVAVFCTWIVSSRMTPIYESTATIDVDRQAPAGVIGQEATPTAVWDADQFLATQVRLIQSDSVLRPVVQKYRVESSEEQSNQRNTRNDTVRLGDLRVARPPNTYLLLISYRSPDREMAAEVANAVAQSYIQHTWNIRYKTASGLSDFMQKQLEELKVKMEQSGERLVRFERELNVINPEEKTNILSARLLQLNTEYTRAQSERVGKEAAYNSIKNGMLEAAQVSSQGESLKRIGERLDEARQKFAEVKAHFGPNHPEYKKAAGQLLEIQRLQQEAARNTGRRVEIEYNEAVNRELILQKAVSESKADYDRLNARSYEYQTVKREAEADKKLYEELVRKIREAGINSSFQNSAIRLADPARTSGTPVSPNTKRNVVLAFVFSSLLALATAFMSDRLDDTIRDPEQVALSLKSQVIGSLPVVKPWRGRVGLVSTNGHGPGSDLAPKPRERDQATASFDEAIGMLRSSILLTDFDRRLHSLMITSAAPGEGKSTIAAHLAVAHAQQKKKTLLIDGDLRRPSVHRLFGLTPKKGFSDVVLNGTLWQEATIKPGQLPELDILPAGHSSRIGIDLITNGLLRILEESSKEYDLVVLDSPPLLGLAEPLQMATVADGIVVVALAGQTSRKAVNLVVSTLRRLRANVIGLVLNEVTKDLTDLYYYDGYYKRYQTYYGGNNHG